MIEHVALQTIRNSGGFSNSVLNFLMFNSLYEQMIKNIVKKIADELATTYIDSYPANVFKNQTKCKTLAEKAK